MAKRKDMPIRTNRQLSPLPQRLETSNERTEIVPGEKPTVHARVVNCTSLHVRRGPSKETDSLGTVKSGEIVVVKSSLTSDWVYIYYPQDSLTGYMRKEYLEAV